MAWRLTNLFFLIFGITNEYQYKKVEFLTKDSKEILDFNHYVSCNIS